MTRDPCHTDPVSNLTLSLDADTLRRARIRALEQGTSVNAVVREFLDAYAAGSATQAKQAIRVLARASTAGSTVVAPARTWVRDDVYSERTQRPPL